MTYQLIVTNRLGDTEVRGFDTDYERRHVMRQEYGVPTSVFRMMDDLPSGSVSVLGDLVTWC